MNVATRISSAVAIADSGRRERAVLLAGATAAALLLCTFAVFGPLRGRVADFAAVHDGGASPSSRGLVWAAGIRLAEDYAWTGSGFGALREVLPAYIPRGEGGVWAQIHNDFLEVYIAGGLVAVTLASWLTITFAQRVWRATRREGSAGRRLPALGLVLGLVALAVHEAVDFNLQIPANALLFVVMAAICVSPFARSHEEP